MLHKNKHVKDQHPKDTHTLSPSDIKSRVNKNKDLCSKPNKNNKDAQPHVKSKQHLPSKSTLATY